MADPNLIENERRKLSANSLNRLSTVCVAFGIVSVIAGYLHSVGSLRAAVPGLGLGLGRDRFGSSSPWRYTGWEEGF